MKNTLWRVGTRGLSGVVGYCVWSMFLPFFSFRGCYSVNYTKLTFCKYNYTFNRLYYIFLLMCFVLVLLQLLKVKQKDCTKKGNDCFSSCCVYYLIFGDLSIRGHHQIQVYIKSKILAHFSFKMSQFRENCVFSLNYLKVWN